MVEGSTSESSGEETPVSSGQAPAKNGATSSKRSAKAQDSHDQKELLNGMPKEKYMSFKPPSPDRMKSSPMEVVVDHGVERAIKVLKRKLIKEGLFKELKSRRYFSKPSEEKKRKLKESLKKIRKEEARRQKSQMMF